MASSRRRPGPNEDLLRQVRERTYEARPPENHNIWKPPAQGEWWAVAPDSTIHMIGRVNNKLRVTYVVPLCGGRWTQARVEVPYGSLRENSELLDHVCNQCWSDLRATAISLLRYQNDIVPSTDEIDKAVREVRILAQAV